MSKGSSDERATQGHELLPFSDTLWRVAPTSGEQRG